MPSVDTKQDTIPITQDGEHDRFAHYVEKDQILEAFVNGKPVIALCGKVWVPSGDPDKYPVCKTCAEILDQLSRGDGHQV